jgi:hypothetical protein
MTIDKVTSLADLAFKAKTNKYYKKLAIIAAEYLGGYFEQKTYEYAINTLYRVARFNDPNSCLSVVNAINNLRNRVEENPDPVVERLKNIKKEDMPYKDNISFNERINEECERRQRRQWEQMMEREYEEQHRRWRSYDWIPYYDDHT